MLVALQNRLLFTGYQPNSSVTMRYFTGSTASWKQCAQHTCRLDPAGNIGVVTVCATCIANTLTFE